MGTDLLLLHAAATWALVGLIWTIQLVQYPGFAYVGGREFRTFHQHHSSRITWVVAPLMFLELATGLALLGNAPPSLSPVILWAGMTLVALNWACTAFVAVPLHRKLTTTSTKAQRALVLTNWIRTAAWTARGVGALLVLRNLLLIP